MKEILKPIFGWIVDQYQLFENPIYNYIIMAIIGIIGFSVAFRFVGDLYRMDLIDCRAAGSIIHWIVRLIVVTMLFLTVGGMIWFVKFIVSLSWWIWAVVGAAVLLTIIAMAVYQLKKRQPTTESE